MKIWKRRRHAAGPDSLMLYYGSVAMAAIHWSISRELGRYRGELLVPSTLASAYGDDEKQLMKVIEQRVSDWCMAAGLEEVTKEVNDGN